MSPKPPPAVPFSIETAVDGQRAFLEQLRAIVREEVQRATGEAVDKMNLVSRSQELLIKNLNHTSGKVTTIAVDIDRLVGLMTVREAHADMLEMKIDKFFKIVTPFIANGGPTPDPDRTPR